MFRVYAGSLITLLHRTVSVYRVLWYLKIGSGDASVKYVRAVTRISFLNP